ncbi:50S ribosomal protein L10 [Candidatus Uhrbacteria bacterium]|nr:50S ribosomal protein L10 [Candidatus Uhrbacteria bacterium]
MAKTRIKKEDDVGRYVEALKGATAVVFADLAALKVVDNGSLRREAEKSEVGIIASKKTLLRRALKEAGIGQVDEAALSGSVYMLAARGDQIVPAKLVAGISRKNDKVTILGGLLESKWLTAAEVRSLATLPSKEQLIAQVVGSIRAPLSGLVGVMQGNLRGLVQVLNAVKESKT